MPFDESGVRTDFFENHLEQCMGVLIPLDVRSAENVARLLVHVRAPTCRVSCTALSRFCYYEHWYGSRFRTGG